MSELGQVLAGVDKFENDLGFTAPELIPMRIGQLREMVRGIFEDDEDLFGDDDEDAEPRPAPELAVTASRLGHALAALREIAEPSDDNAHDTARNALDDDKAIREGSAVKAAPELAEPVTVAGVPCTDYPSVVAAMQAEIDRERTKRLHLAGGRDEARSDFSRLRTVLLDDGLSDTVARRRCLAIIATAGTPPVGVPLDVQRKHRPGDCRCTPCKAAEARPPVDWARVSEAVADRERERDEARNRLGHALAALREIADDEFPRDTARNALDDDKAIREGSAVKTAPALADPAAVAGKRRTVIHLATAGTEHLAAELAGRELAYAEDQEADEIAAGDDPDNASGDWPDRGAAETAL